MQSVLRLHIIMYYYIVYTIVIIDSCACYTWLETRHHQLDKVITANKITRDSKQPNTYNPDLDKLASCV